MAFEIGKLVALGDQALPPSKAEIEQLLSLAPQYGLEIRVPGH